MAPNTRVMRHIGIKRLTNVVVVVVFQTLSMCIPCLVTPKIESLANELNADDLKLTTKKCRCFL